MLHEAETELIIESGPPGDGGLFAPREIVRGGEKKNGKEDFKKYPEK